MGQNILKIEKKQSHRKYIITAVIVLFLIMSALVLIVYTDSQKPDPASEAIIRKAAATQLGKDPNSITDEDFEKITELSIGEKTETIFGIYDDGSTSTYAINQLSDIKLLRKFTNLKILYLGSINVPEHEIPYWMVLLEKIGIYDVEARFALDLKPLEKLNNLEKLQLGGTAVHNIEPLANLNLKTLQLIDAQTSDLEPIKNLAQLQKVYIIFCPKLKYEDLEDLKKAKPNLDITTTILEP